MEDLVYEVSQPDDLTSLVLRTDFSEDRKWRALQSVLDIQGEGGDATYASDPAYAEIVQSLAEAAAEDDPMEGKGGRDNG